MNKFFENTGEPRALRPAKPTKNHRELISAINLLTGGLVVRIPPAPREMLRAFAGEAEAIQGRRCAGAWQSVEGHRPQRWIYRQRDRDVSDVSLGDSWPLRPRAATSIGFLDRRRPTKPPFTEHDSS